MQRYQQFKDPFEIPEFERSLPIHLPVILYYRQSTLRQVGNMSTSIQTVDMVDKLIYLGWRRDQIIMIDQDAGVSGTTAIDEREGMSEAFSLIIDGKVGAVACQDEDRLFRDLTAIQYNIFLDKCKKHDVWVLTPTTFYDFNHPSMGSFFEEMFRSKCAMAAQYITHYIKGRLNRARLKRMKEGRWAGGSMAPGYMVDDRKTLSNGVPNDMWRRYVPFEPAAEVVLEWFRLFVEQYAGNIWATREHLLQYGPHLRLSYEVPEGYRVFYTVHARGQSIGCPSSRGLVYLLTNAAYLGHWVVKGAVLFQNTHLPIVPEDLFMQAFNYLSATSFDGSPNPNYTPRIIHARPTLEADRTAERPLCAGLLMHEYDGKQYPVGTEWDTVCEHYSYRAFRRTDPPITIFHRRAEPIDALIVSQLHERLTATFTEKQWDKAIQSVKQDTGRERRALEEQLQSVLAQRDNLINNLAAANNPALAKAASIKFADLEVEEARLQELLKARDREAARAASLEQLRQSSGAALENWPYMMLDAKRNILHAYVECIVAHATDASVQLTIHWRDGSITEHEVANTSGGRTTRWTDTEVEKLRDLFNQQKCPLEIASQFPTRSWTAIMLKARLVVKVPEGVYACPFPSRGMTYEEYQAKLGMADTNTENQSESTRCDRPCCDRSGSVLRRPYSLHGCGSHRGYSQTGSQVPRISQARRLQSRFAGVRRDQWVE